MKRVQPWFTLKSVPGVGNYIFKRLIDRFNTPENVFEASFGELTEIQGISKKIATLILEWRLPDSSLKDMDSALKRGINIVTMKDPEYPALLLQMPDPPPFLYVLGTIYKDLDGIAVVGSRMATSYGLKTAFDISRDLAKSGIEVISGLARGIDTAAHKGALSARGRTIAVLGSGLGRIYPAENRALAREITQNGALVSEFPVFTEPEPKNFPMRNRIISGMTHGTVVVEAAQKSGSLITARLAAEQGREVFAVPGSINSFKSAGAHKLLKQGACLIENASDIIEELSHVLNRGQHRSDRPSCNNKSDFNKNLLDFQEAQVFNALDPYPVHIDELARRVEMDAGTISGILLKLELIGLVIQSPGKRFSLKEE